MLKPIRLVTIAHLPPPYLAAFLRHMRAFDRAHPGCTFEIVADTPDQTVREAVGMLLVKVFTEGET